ncbi:glycosyltransferase [Alcanivorax sp.]|uniref:glycosyltransferase n=1 Tax=Alcanivorax sp. TaxID=1872427 RepID=UPI0025B7EADC|nr:glycosyltransferase [Alcanivorax sp.]
MTKKICMVVTDAVSFNVLCRGQLEFLTENYDVDLTLVSGGGKKDILDLEKRRLGRFFYIPFQRKPSVFRDFYCLLMLWFFFLRNRFDVVVYSTPKAMLITSLATFFSFQRVRFSILRGRVYESYVGFKRRLYLLFDKIVISLSTANLAISHSLKKSYCDDGFNKEIIHVLGEGSSNGVDVDVFCPSRCAAFKCSSMRVGVVGRICKDKGILQVLEVIKRVKLVNPDVEFFLVGDIEDADGIEAVREMVENSLATHYAYTDDVSLLFSGIDAHLFLTHREGFGNVALEAAACSVPTFAFDVVGVRDSVKDGVTGVIFEFDDIESVVSEIVAAASDLRLFKSKYPLARQWAIDNFEQKMVWENYFDFFLK